MGVRGADWVVGLTVWLSIASSFALAGQDSENRACTVDVGVHGVCMYGHWLSGDIELRLEGCNFFIGGFKSFPSAVPGQIVIKEESCPEHMVRKAAGRYEYVAEILRAGRLYIVGPSTTHNIPAKLRHSAEFQDAVAAAIAAESPITNENWDSSVLWASTAELIRAPMPVPECGGY